MHPAVIQARLYEIHRYRGTSEADLLQIVRRAEMDGWAQYSRALGHDPFECPCVRCRTWRGVVPEPPLFNHPTREIKVSPALWYRVESLGEQWGLSPSSLVALALSEFLKSRGVDWT